MITVAVLLVGTVGALYSGVIMGHGNDHGGMSMMPCSYAAHASAACDMGVVEHISTWQGMFSSVPFGGMLSLLLLLAFAVLVSFRLYRYPPALRLSFFPLLVALDPETNLHKPLQRFTVRGLLNPKPY